jgi:ribosomal-protein-alanine N-acetyltransferase
VSGLDVALSGAKLPVVVALAPLVTRIRPRLAADDAFMVRLSLAAFGEFSRSPGQSILHMARAGATWVAERGAEAVGFAIVHGAGQGHAELSAIAVEEHARGVGVGAALLTQVERALVRAGTAELTVHTAQANSAALELFSKRGFHTEQRLPRYYRGVFDACTMRKRIA